MRPSSESAIHLGTCPQNAEPAIAQLSARRGRLGSWSLTAELRPQHNECSGGALFEAGVVVGLGCVFDPTVMKHVERAGAPRRRHLLTDLLDEARQLYDQGWSLASIGTHFGVNASTVWHALRRAGVPMRDTHGR